MPNKINSHHILIKLTPSNVVLKGILNLPLTAKKLIIFAHGSGSGRLSPRNQAVADGLNKKNMGTLLLDLLTTEEELIDNSTHQLRFNIPLLALRLIETAAWATQNSSTKDLKIGYFGASTGAAAALIAAQEGDGIFAIVSRGGRPDLAMDFLNTVKAPSLLIVGGNDLDVIQLNQKALAKIPCEKKLTIVPGATHLFEEPGTLEQVSQLAAEWFENH